MMLWQFPYLDQVQCAFTSKYEGNISYEVEDDPDMVRVRRQNLQLELNLQNIAELKQVHGSEVVWDNTQAYPDLPVGDGQATAKSGLGLLIKTADCQPILITHKTGKYICALHVGWRGNRNEFIQQAIAQFCHKYSLKPRDLLAVRGPSLSPAKAEFLNFNKEWSDEFRLWFNAQLQTMNLWELSKHQLKQAGLLEYNLYSLDFCTYSLPDFFFSYRVNPKTGRQGSLIWIV